MIILYAAFYFIKREMYSIHEQSVFPVSDAVAMQNEWTFARASRLLTSLFRKVKTFHTANESEFLNFRISIININIIYNLISTLMHICLFIFKCFYKRLTAKNTRIYSLCTKPKIERTICGVVVPVTVGCDLQCGAAAVSIAAGSGGS